MLRTSLHIFSLMEMSLTSSDGSTNGLLIYTRYLSPARRSPSSLSTSPPAAS